MQAENMKLLDLQTGKYLELGKDFLYGGNFIIIEPYNIASNIMCFFLECFKDANSIEEGMIFLQKKALQNKQNNISDDVIMNVLHKSEPQEPLKTLCKTTGAVVYGGRYVLLNGFKVPESNKYDKDHYFIGDVASVCVNAYDKADEYRLMILASCESVLLRWYEIHKFKKQGHFCITSEIDTDYSDWFENIFEEYSKQLRNEPNKFDELIQHFK